MEHKLSCKICQRLVIEDVISAEYEEVYVYGLELVLSFIVNTLIIVAIGSIANRVFSTIVFLLIFILLRRLTGGYHAQTHRRCRICTIVSYLGVLVLTTTAPLLDWCYWILSIVGTCTIFAMAPIENPNKPIEKSRRYRLKISSVAGFLALNIIGYCVYSINLTLSMTIFYTLALVIALIIITIFQKGEQSNETVC